MQAVSRWPNRVAVTARQGGQRQAEHVLVQFVTGDADGGGDRRWCLAIVADLSGRPC